MAQLIIDPPGAGTATYSPYYITVATAECNPDGLNPWDSISCYAEESKDGCWWGSRGSIQGLQVDAKANVGYVVDSIDISTSYSYTTYYGDSDSGVETGHASASDCASQYSFKIDSVGSFGIRTSGNYGKIGAYASFVETVGGNGKDCADLYKGKEQARSQLQTITVHFRKISHTLKVNASASCGDAVTILPKSRYTINNWNGDLKTFNFSATPNPGFRVTGWSLERISGSATGTLVEQGPTATVYISESPLSCLSLYDNFRVNVCVEPNPYPPEPPGPPGPPPWPPGPGPDPDCHSYIYIHGIPDNPAAFTNVSLQNTTYQGECSGTQRITMSCTMAAGYTFKYWINTATGAIVSRDMVFSTTLSYPSKSGECNYYYYTACSDGGSSSSSSSGDVTVTVTTNPECHATAEGGGTYAIGDSVTITTSACCCPFVFAYWLNMSSGEKIYAKTHTFTAETDISFEARYNHPSNTHYPYHDETGYIICRSDGKIYFDGNQITWI